MKQTEQTLLEQMRITEFEIAHRQNLLALTQEDFNLLKACKGFIESKIDRVVDEFYEMQTNIPEISLLIGDADTLARLQNAQHRYILDLFSGLYDLEYMNNRLRIGLVHKRIGVEPKLYLSAVSTLKILLQKVLSDSLKEGEILRETLKALDKLFLFDITLVFETYIRSLVSELETSKEKSESYASALETKVKERTHQLEELSRTDPLTGLLNVRGLVDTLTLTLRAAKRRSEWVSVVYMDVNDFKVINDTQGHAVGDDVLRVVSSCIQKISRMEDSCYRYGGDEFCLILPNCKAQDAEEIYIHRLRKEIHEHMGTVMLSIGISQAAPEDDMDAETLIKQADQKMYEDKQRFKKQKKV